MEGTIDFTLLIHYDKLGNAKLARPDGYIISFHTSEIISEVKEKLGIEAELNIRYRFSDSELFKKLSELRGTPEYSNVFGDDAWILYAYENKNYWKDVYGKENLEKEYQEHQDYKNLKELVYGR